MFAEEFLNDGGSYHHHFCSFLDVLFRKALTFLNGPLFDVEIVHTLTIHRGIGIVITIDGLTAGSHLCRHLRDKLLLAHDAFVVRHLQRLHRRWVLTHTTTHICTRTDGQQVGTHRGEFGTNALFRALSDTHHDDDSCHTNNDTQHGKEGTHLVVRYRLQAYLKKI